MNEEVSLQWLARHPVEVAFDLIGCELVVDRGGVRTAGRIVECEAYAGPRDAASHTARLAVAKDVMGRESGTIYTYLSYGIHSMMNIVAHEVGLSGAVLIRALEPTEGIDTMRRRRGSVPDTRLCAGPGTLTQAMDIRLSDLGSRLGSDIKLMKGTRGQVMSSPRIGISKATEAPWRFWEEGNRNVSSHRRGMITTRQSMVASIVPPDMDVR